MARKASAAPDKQPRRARGEGSIYHREDLGLWAAQPSLRRADGSRWRPVLYGETKEAVAQKLRKLLHQADQGTLPDPTRVTVKEFLERWIDDHAYRQLSPVTAYGYEGKLKKYIFLRLGKIKVQALKRTEVQQAVNDWIDAGCSRTSLGIALTALRSAIKTAIEWEIRETNPVDHVALPRERRPARKAPEQERPRLTPDEAQRLLATSRSHPAHIIWLLGLACGLRAGEATGLCCGDVDLRRRQLTVRAAMKVLPRKRGGLQEGPPKTKRSARRVPIPEYASEEIRVYLAALSVRLGRPVCDDDKLALNSRLRPFIPGRLCALLHTASEHAGIPYVTPHGLRRSCASFLMARRIPLPVIQQILGHEDVETSLLYTLASSAEYQEAADALDAALAWRPPPPDTPPN